MWQTDPESGEKVMPSDWSEFLDWLLSEDRVPATQKEWAADRGLHERTVRRWKADPRFTREWDRRAAELNVHPERTQSVVDALYKQAAQGDVKAATLYLQYIDKFTPKRRVLVDDERDASGMSDVELAAELEDLIDELRSEDA
ncbi:MAG: phBC6A51 family helix-turn-helix protein [Pseudomonadota bacterium]|nr:phBC6A51 family helix-turn-helix protein [Pseudomonadota bacterium]